MFTLVENNTAKMANKVAEIMPKKINAIDIIS